MNRIRNAKPSPPVPNLRPLPASKKVYVHGTRGVRVPMREISMQPTREMNGQIELNPPVRVYDTSGPYTDPEVQLDLRQGLPPLRLPWILERGEYDRMEPPDRPLPEHSYPVTP